MTDNAVGEVFKIAASGVVSLYSNRSTPSSGIRSFGNPTGIAVNAAGVLFVADASEHRIWKVDLDGTVTAFAGSGQAGFVDGLGVVARFDTPTGVALDSGGNLFVADAMNNVIRGVTASGYVSTVAGMGLHARVDATGNNAQFDFNFVDRCYRNVPMAGIAVDVDDNVFIADPGNNAIRKLTGPICLKAGSGTSLCGGTISADVLVAEIVRKANAANGNSVYTVTLRYKSDLPSVDFMVDSGHIPSSVTLVAPVTASTYRRRSSTKNAAGEFVWSYTLSNSPRGIYRASVFKVASQQALSTAEVK